MWNFVKRICSNPALLQEAVNQKLAALAAEQGSIEAELQHAQNEFDKLIYERQWVITQARKGSITEDDMQIQLTVLQSQELGLRKGLDEYHALVAVKQQAEALASWAMKYLSEINSGIRVLDIDVGTMDEAQQSAVAHDLQAGRFEGKFPGDPIAQLRWAILEEKRRVVRTLISRVIVSRGQEGKGRVIKPVLALEVPLDQLPTGEFLDSSHQSLSYIEQAGREKAEVRSLPAK